MNENQYAEIVLVDGETVTRDKAYELCQKCGAKAGAYHQPYCMNEICPLCGKFLIECNHIEGYALESAMNRE